ncbi:MAG: endonuclease MutS2, partial [Bacteroidales bacterium]|nr:endonuclease MutS2 [Bacteroidales bacterium]
MNKKTQNIWPLHFEEKVGFDRIRAILLNKCLSLMGTEWVENMAFQNNFENISRMLEETEEFCRILREVESFPSDHFYDLRNALKKIRIEGRFLEEGELFDLKRSLESVRAIVQFFKKQEGDVFPLLKKKTKQVVVFPYIYERIDAILSKTGKIRDNASPALAQIRKGILELQSKMTRRLHSILKQAQKEGLVESDALVTIRDGRAV